MNKKRQNQNRSVSVHIEELVLHGFPPQDRHRIGAALKAELSRLFAEQGVPTALSKKRKVSSLNGGAFEMGPRSTAETNGTQVAQGVYRGLNR